MSVFPSPTRPVASLERVQRMRRPMRLTGRYVSDNVGSMVSRENSALAGSVRTDERHDCSRGANAAVLTLMEESAGCETAGDLERLFDRLKEAVGADHSMMGIIDGPRHSFYSDFPPDWVRAYIDEGFLELDPVIRRNAGCNAPAHDWSDALQGYPVESYRGLEELSADFGLRQGMAAGIRDGFSSRFSVVSLSSGARRRFGPSDRRLLDVILPHLYFALGRVHGQAAPTVQLTARELDVLRWVRDGRTNWEISSALCISENTVRFHLKNIHRKLGTRNKHHAVAMAAAARLMD